MAIGKAASWRFRFAFTAPAFWCALALGCTKTNTDGSEPNAAPRVSSVGAAVPAPLPGTQTQLGAQLDATLLAPGAALPDLTATAQTGEVVKLSELKGKPVVVYFYPKDDTPGCTIEAQEIRDLWEDLKKTQALVIGVSSDDEASHKAFAEKHALPFLLLPDPDHRIANAFGASLNNGRARRTSFVFGRDGRLAKVFPSVTPKGHGRELLESVQALPAQ
jgi:peroxiredoxin Q/BCP